LYKKVYAIEAEPIRLDFCCQRGCAQLAKSDENDKSYVDFHRIKNKGQNSPGREIQVRLADLTEEAQWHRQN
jgi:hypothetical protein